jgi:hypothetical protein
VQKKSSPLKVLRKRWRKAAIRFIERGEFRCQEAECLFSTIEKLAESLKMRARRACKSLELTYQLVQTIG